LYAAAPPAIAVVDSADAAQWQTFVQGTGWRVISPAASPAGIDQKVQAVATAVQEAIQKSEADPAHIYLAGRGDAAAAVFYTISRVPDLWAAAIAVGGSPQPAIETGRIFTANFGRVPVLWLSAGDGDEALAKQLKTAGLNLEWRTSNGATNASLVDWLKQHQRDEFPAEIDCETNAPVFARCYWVQMAKFDPNERNDVLASTRLKAGAGAMLDLGNFGFKTDDAGPGVLVATLPQHYSGPLKLQDRIVAIDGKPIENAAEYKRMIEKFTDEKPAVVTVQRGKDRIRIDTRIVIPRGDPPITARVQGKYDPEDKEILIISRTVTEMRVTVPPQWAQDSKLMWNGLTLEKIEAPGCWLLTVDKEILHAAKCPN